MTDNMDEFDQDQFDAGEEPRSGQRSQSVKQSLIEAWRSKPLFKLLVIMGVVAFAMAGALGAFSGPEQTETARLGRTPDLQEAPGGKSSPFFIEQNKQANEQRVQQALAQGGSAIPTPVGTNVDLSELTEKTKKDPLLEFRAETERLRQELRAEQKQSSQQVQILQQQMKQKAVAEDDTLARAMQKQMQELMQSWQPRKMTTVAGAKTPAEEEAAKAGGAIGQSAQLASLGQAPMGLNKTETKPVKALIPAGAVNYAQLLTEANSDVPGPILAQILSGPLAGGRAIGRFQVMGDYLVMSFNTISYKGKDYAINALALDPDTTLGGMATEVDHRYFSRLVLPAAGAFMQAFGTALSDGGSTTTVSGDTVIVSQAEKGYKDALYEGLGQVGQTMSEFFRSEANKIKTLVRVGVGTPMGLFFLQSVQEPSREGSSATQTAGGTPSLQELLAQQGYLQQQKAIPGMGVSSDATYPSVTSAYGATTYSPYPTSLYPSGQTGFSPGTQLLSPGTSYNTGNTTIYRTR